MRGNFLGQSTKIHEASSKDPEKRVGLLKRVWLFIKAQARKFDNAMDGAASFFLKHYGKTRFMVAMSKKAQYLGLERLYEKGPKAFLYFFLFYLVRDTILYIIIPIYFAKWTSGS